VEVTYAAFGEMAVTVDGARTPLRRRRERDVLGVLLAARGAPVPAERLVAEVWGEEQDGLAPVQVAVSRLRSVIEPGRAARTGSVVANTPAGYVLRAEPNAVDTWEFESAAERALRPAPGAERLAAAEEALSLWTSVPYAETTAPSVRAEADRLAELRLSVEEHRAQALLDLGRPEDAARALAGMAPQHPFRERLWGLLALAQYQSARQADALETLRTLREQLADELGVDPSPELRALEEAVLRQDDSLRVEARIESVPTAPTAPSPTAAPPATAPPGTSPAGVGRDELLDGATTLMQDAVRTHSPRWLLVQGDPGIGKTRLVGDLANRAVAQGIRVIVGRCHDGAFASPLWPWVEVVRRLVGDGAPDPLLEPLLSGAASEESGAGSALRMFDAVGDLLSRSAAEAPILLVLEDVHWADATSLRLLAHLAATGPTGPITVVATRRTTETATSGPLVDALAALARAGAERIRLDGLAEDDVRTLLEGSVGPHGDELDAHVAHVTGGNPFFVLQYARLLASTPELLAGDPAGLPVPDGVRDVLHQRVARLPEGAGRMLRSASVLGPLFEPDLLAELAELPAEECLDLLDLALAAGLIEERDSSFAFVHALARDTVHGELNAARRMRLHDKAGRLIEARRGDDPDAVAEVARHAHVAAPLGREHAARARTWLARAATLASSRHAHAEALELWEQVLANTDPGAIEAAHAHRGQAGALVRLGRMREANDALDRALEVATACEDWPLVADATRVLSNAGPWSWREHGVLHAPRIDLISAALPHLDPPGQARLLAILQMEYVYRWESAVVEDLGRRSVRLAREVGDPALLRDVLMLRIGASTGAWEAEERLGLVEELLALTPEGELGVTALFYLGQVRWDCGDPAGADEAMARCAEAAARVRHSGLDIPLGWWRAARARDREDPEATALLDDVLARHREVGYVAHNELECLAAIRRGPAGSPVSDATIALARTGGMPMRALVGHALLESGEPERAHELLGDWVRDDITDYCSTAGRCLRLLVLSETGSEADIRRALAPVEDHLGAPVAYGTVDHLGSVDHFVAAAYRALGDPRAEQVARSAVARAAELGTLPWLRRSEALLARITGTTA
jgi:DNA-binding SARP family transcriptional activator